MTKSILVVHSQRINDCSHIKSYLDKAGILAQVGPAKRRIDCNTGDCRSYFGCHIYLKEIADNTTLINKVWSPLNDRYNFSYTRVYHRKK